MQLREWLSEARTWLPQLPLSATVFGLREGWVGPSWLSKYHRNKQDVTAAAPTWVQLSYRIRFPAQVSEHPTGSSSLRLLQQVGSPCLLLPHLFLHRGTIFINTRPQYISLYNVCWPVHSMGCLKAFLQEWALWTESCHIYLCIPGLCLVFIA